MSESQKNVMWVLFISVLSSSFSACLAKNQAWFFRQSTHGAVYEMGKTVTMDEVPMPETPGSDEVLLELIATSVLPSHRARMEPEIWTHKSAYAPFELNGIVDISIVAVVREVGSEVAALKVGDTILNSYPLVQHQVVKADGSDSTFGFPATVLPSNVPYEKFLSMLSFGGGYTAYYGVEYFEAGKVKAGQTVLVTSAASTVGQLVGQLYKMKGAIVIGSTSTRVKADQVMALGGYDHMIAYKEEDFETRLNELAPEGIDLDFEMVGGTQLSAALRNMKPKGTVVLCGMISDYNVPGDKKYGVQEINSWVLKEITIQGLYVLNIVPHLAEAIPKMKTLIAEGKLKSQETVIEGFERWGEAVDMMLNSKNTGRLIVKAHSSDEVSRAEL